MRPRTQLQVRVFSLSKDLPNLEEKLKPWVFENTIKHWGYRTKTSTSCLCCGHVWKGEPVKQKDICPSCNRKLIIQNTRKRKVTQRVWAGVIDTCEEFQLNRFFEMYAYFKAGHQPRLFIWEIVQQWIQPGGKNEVVARNRNQNWYQDSFCGDLEIRDRNNLRHKYNIFPDNLYPGAKCLPIYKRYGIKGRLVTTVAPFDLFTKLLEDPTSETLLKANQHALLGARFGDKESVISRYWSSIKICIRNNYIVKNPITYLDYLDLLRQFNKDLHNSKYVCPANLKRQHDRLVDKKLELEKLAEFEKKRKTIEKNEPEYHQSKHKYFGIAFSDHNITIKVLESVKEFLEESVVLKHCVFTNNYFKKSNSLILSARIENRPVETIEIDLAQMKILQARGFQNKISKHHDQIVDLVNKNMRLIKKVHKEATPSESVAA